MFAYISDSGESFPWIDHFVYSRFVDSHVRTIDILYNFVTSDYRHSALQIDGIFAVSSI